MTPLSSMVVTTVPASLTKGHEEQAKEEERNQAKH
jgi:hypothetical protein